MARKSRKGLAAQENAPQLKPSKSWRAALYIRLSVEFNGKRGDSLETQRQIMEAHLALLPDIEIARIYTDNGFTGQTFERPAFQQMLADIETGKINCVVVKDLSRLGRNAIDSGFYIEKFFPLHQVRFIAVNDNFDSEDSDNSGSHITMPIKNILAEAYALDIGKKVKSQRLQSMRDGKFTGPYAPYGYQKDPSDRHHLIPDENTAPIVRQIFAWAADGVSIHEMNRRLNANGTLTPSRYLINCGFRRKRWSENDEKWQTWTLRKILKNEVYTGDLVQGKHQNIKRKICDVPEENWIIVRNTHEPLISRELFQKIQESREQRAQIRNQRTTIPFSPNLLVGRVICGCCGRKMIRRKSGKYYYYFCASNQRVEQNFCENRKQVRENKLFHLILTLVQQAAQTIIGNSQRLRAQDAKLNAQTMKVHQEVIQLQQKIRSGQKFLASLYENLITGVLTVDEYRSMKAGYEREITSAIERTQQIQHEQETLERQCQEYINLADLLANINEDTELTAVLIEQLIHHITINSPTDIVVKFKFENGFDRVREVLHDARD